MDKIIKENVYWKYSQDKNRMLLDNPVRKEVLFSMVSENIFWLPLESSKTIIHVRKLKSMKMSSK